MRNTVDNGHGEPVKIRAHLRFLEVESTAYASGVDWVVDWIWTGSSAFGQTVVYACVATESRPPRPTRLQPGFRRAYGVALQ